MRILLWTQYFWPEHFHINEVALCLREVGEDVTVLTGKPNYPDGVIFEGYRTAGIQEQSHHGIQLVRLPLRPRGGNKALGLALNYLSFIFSGYLLGPLALRGRQFDVVFVYAPSPILQALPAIFFAWSRSIPLVLWVQDLWPEALVSTGFVRNAMLLRIVERVVRHIYRHSDLLLIPSEAFREPIRRLGGDPTKTHLHSNSSKTSPELPTLGVDTQRLVQAIHHQFSVVYAGNIGTVQSIDTVVTAATLLRTHEDIRLYLIGSGSMMASVAEEIGRLGLTNISMPGWVSPMEMPAIYEAATVLLLSMKDDARIYRTIPNKLQVYMAAGKPIIVSGNGEPARVLRQAQAGLASPAGDARALADTVLLMKSMTPEQLERFGKNGRAWFIQHFDLKDRTAALVEHFRRVIQKYKSRH